MHATGEYSISDLAELFSVSRPTAYRTLNRRHSPERTILPPTGIDPLSEKLRLRDPDAFKRMNEVGIPDTHPLFEVVPGPVES